MGNIFSNKSFMNRYFSAPKSTGPAEIDAMHNGEPGVQKEDFEQFSGPAKTVEELEQKKKDMQLGKHRVKPGGDPKNVKKFNKKIGRINKRIDNKSDDEGAGPAKKEPKRVKIESEGMAGQGSTEYIRGGREGDKNARSVTIEKDYAGKDQKVVRRKKKDGSVKTKSKKISSKRAERIKKRKDKSHSAVS